MSPARFRVFWESLTPLQQQSVRLKAKWEQMTIMAVCKNYPGIWNDEKRLAEIRDAWENGAEMPNG